MSKKDFELIARTVRDLATDPSFGAYEQRRTAEAFASALAATNPRFDRARFLKACGVES